MSLRPLVLLLALLQQTFFNIHTAPTPRHTPTPFPSSDMYYYPYYPCGNYPRGSYPRGSSNASSQGSSQAAHRNHPSQNASRGNSGCNTYSPRPGPHPTQLPAHPYARPSVRP
jgi:hypothetical protein